MASDMTRLLRMVKRAGWSVERGRKNHLRLTSPRGEVIWAESTASDHRSIKNTEARLRAAGLPVPHKGGHRPREREHR